MTEMEMKGYVMGIIRESGGTALPEWPLNGRARVDVVAAFPSAGGMPSYGFYELKSDHDTLKRLGRQISRYYEVSPLVSVVVAETHLDGIFKAVECATVGVGHMESNGRCWWIRPPRVNTDRLDRRQMFSQLRKKERERVTGIKGMGACLRYQEQLKIFESLPLDDVLTELSDLFVRRARERAGQ